MSLAHLEDPAASHSQDQSQPPPQAPGSLRTWPLWTWSDGNEAIVRCAKQCTRQAAGTADEKLAPLGGGVHRSPSHHSRCFRKRSAPLRPASLGLRGTRSDLSQIGKPECPRATASKLLRKSLVPKHLLPAGAPRISRSCTLSALPLTLCRPAGQLSGVRRAQAAPPAAALPHRQTTRFTVAGNRPPTHLSAQAH